MTTTSTTTLTPRVARAVNGAKDTMPIAETEGSDMALNAAREPPKRSPRRLRAPSEPLVVDNPSKLSSADAEKLGRLFLEARRRGVEIEDLVREAREVIDLFDRIGLGVLP